MGGKLGAGRAGADDDDPRRIGARPRRDHRRDEQFAEFVGIGLGVEPDGVFGDALGAEIGGDAAQRDDADIVGEVARRGQEPAVLVVHVAEPHGLRRPVDRLDPALLEAEAAHLGEHVEADLGKRRVHRAGGEFMQARLPQMGADRIDQRHGTALVGSQLRRQFQPAGAAAEDQDAFALRLHVSRPAGPAHPGTARSDR